MAKYSNSLTSHHPESTAHGVDKMSGMDKKMKQELAGKSKTYIKKFTTRKNRQTIKQLNKIELNG